MDYIVHINDNFMKTEIKVELYKKICKFLIFFVIKICFFRLNYIFWKEVFIRYEK